MVYTISPVHTTESFLKVAETLVEMGTDSLMYQRYVRFVGTC